MSLNQITKFRMPGGGGEEVALVDWTHKPLFSSGDFLDSFVAQKTSLFQYVVGDQVPGVGPSATTVVRRTATENDTNISTPGAMASTEEMLIYGIRVEYFELDTSDAADLTTATERLNGEPMMKPESLGVLNRSLLLKLVISQKEFANAGIGYFVTGFGPFMTGGNLTLAAGGRSFASQGVPGHNAVQAFAIPHHIGGQEKYTVDIVNPTGGAVAWAISEATPPVADASNVCRMRVYLDGLYKRPVS